VEESRAKGASTQEQILAVGNPKFNRDRFPLLENLEDAENEAIESAALYPQRIVLNGAEATEADVVASLKRCDVAHLAVHCLVEEKSPWLAALVLAGSNQERGSTGQSSVLSARSVDDGMLYLNEVYGFTLPRTRLVVLSACQSGLGQYYRGEGIVSLVRPFLALRVPMVVASLWAINSQATSSLMVDFHRNRKATSGTMEASDALRLAQIKMAESGPYQHPYYWAPFIAVGSNN
jgi:CHAT domain-containing protein